MARRGWYPGAVIVLVAGSALQSRQLPPPEFDVVSIKRNTAGPEAGGGLRTLPDGTFTMTNLAIRSIILTAAPVPVRDVVGLPGWVMTERYDITAKPPAGATTDQRGEMFRRMFEERMQLKAHVEEREQNTFALVLDRADGRLGPQLTPSTLDCTARFPQEQAQADPKSRCGASMGPGTIVSGGVTMDALVRSLAGLAGGIVNNRTGLQGPYALTLGYAPRALGAPDSSPDAVPDFFTALREQLGLKLQPERSKVPVLVVDSIERPSEN